MQRSEELKCGPERAAHRALLFSLGLTREDLKRPFIAVANSWNEIVPCCVHLRALADAVKTGVREAGGVPFEFNTIGVCDGMAQGHVGMRYSLPSREVIASSAEIMLQAHRFDAAVFISSCDKVTPGMLMAAARVNIPSIFVCAGAMRHGRYRGRKLTLSSMREYIGGYREGRLTLQDLEAVEAATCPGPGACSMMGTANTMACVAEALGFAFPGSATSPAAGAAKLREARRAGRQVLWLLKHDLRPHALMNRQSLENALRVVMAMGGSTNALLHLPALAREVGVSFDLLEMAPFTRSTPYLAAVNPSSPEVTVNDFHRAGGVPALMRSLGGLLHLDQPTVGGRSVGEICQRARVRDGGIIRPAEDPLAAEASLIVLTGSLAPRGAVAKRSAARREMWRHRGPARVFESMESALEGLLAKAIRDGDVVVIRGEGPVGGPGMREMHMITSLIAGMKHLAHTALVTDGRFSGSTRGPCVGHVCPEAAAGGPIAAVRDGDQITIDLERGRLELELPPREISRRLARKGARSAGTAPASGSCSPADHRGVLGLYARLARPADEGG